MNSESGLVVNPEACNTNLFIDELHAGPLNIHHEVGTGLATQRKPVSRRCSCDAIFAELILCEFLNVPHADEVLEIEKFIDFLRTLAHHCTGRIITFIEYNHDVACNLSVIVTVYF